ncbi:MAG TPA: GH25 family lysozyme [Streptosporangiaceae bacterium]|nr:GH25 family lysozyme [Streptosporangiaceae bacterium]
MRRAMAAVAAVGITLLGATGAAVASQASASAPGVQLHASAIRTGSVSRSNVGASHSPIVERLLAGTAATAPRAASARTAEVAAAASTVQGIDVSSGQHPGGAAIDWDAVANAGYKFAFIKAAEGSYYVNPYYASDEAEAQAAGMLVAPYEFAIPNYSGGTLQADYALDHAQYAPDGQMLAPVLDIEYDPYAGSDGTPGGSFCYGLTQTQMVAWIGAFTAEIHRRTGQSPVIYTTAQWWDTCTGDSTAFSSDPLWIAAPGTASPTLPAAWSDWTYWQYSSSASLSGVPTNFDVSHLSSTALELAAPASQSDQTGRSASLGVRSLYGETTAPTYSATGLPTGLQIDPSSGAVSGTLPASAASFPVAITATAGVQSATQSFSWYVHSRVHLAAMGRLSGSVGTPIRLRVRATDGLSGCTLRFSARRLPRGLTISSCGIISGWPTTSSSGTAVVQASDSSTQDSFRWRIANANGSGPAGQIKLNRAGKCLAERSTTDIAIDTCGRAASERWTIAADGTVRVGGKCLAAKSSKTTAPGALELTSCSKDGQRWQLGSNAVLKNLGSGRCLADTGTKNGTRAVAAVCQATPNSTGSASTPSTSQQWTLPAGPLTSGIAANCASSLRGSSEPAGAVTLRRCRRSAQQNWTIQPDGALSSAGRCLATAGGGTAPGTQVRLERCIKGAATQVWQLSGGPVGLQVLLPAAGLCLADPGDSARAGTELVIGPCVAGDGGISWRAS